MKVYFIAFLLSLIKNQLIAPINVPTNRQIGNLVPNGFAPQRSRYSQYTFNDDSCPCEKESSICPPCGQSQQQEIPCECSKKRQCPICPQVYAEIHQIAQKQAALFEQQNQRHERQAIIQVQKFKEAEQFAKEMEEQEQRAAEASKLMQEASQKAEIARQNMLRAQAEAKEIENFEITDTITKLDQRNYQQNI